jgi:poly(beta-D-mannuronate) lyase
MRLLLKRTKFLVMLAFLPLMASVANAIPINVALSSNGGVATQSSTIGGPGNDGQLQVASRAIDGDTNGNWFTGKITHTNAELHPWWEVTLGGASLISKIDIWNRTDCCANRLDSFDLFILEAGQIVWQLLNNSYLIASPEATFLPSQPIMGDSVKIQLGTFNYLSLAEVQVWSESNSIPEPGVLSLLFLGLVLLISNSKKPALKRYLAKAR